MLTHFGVFRDCCRVKDPLEPDYIRVPPLPLPTTWCRTVEPFSLVPATPPPGSHYYECNIVDFDLLSLGRTFVGILLDVPWRTSVCDGPGRVDASQLAHLKLDQVVPVGLAFVWAEKEVIADVRIVYIIFTHFQEEISSPNRENQQAVKLMASFGFLYVENMCWIRQYPNHSIVTEEYDYFTKSKSTLLIFKRGDGITLRHQRNPDVVFDIVRRDKYLTEDKPETTHDMIETILPDGNHKDDANPGRFLELYARLTHFLRNSYHVEKLTLFLFLGGEGRECDVRAGPLWCSVDYEFEKSNLCK